MKKITAILFAFVLLLSSSFFVFGKETDNVQVIIPSYSVEISNGPIYYYDSLYPFLSYKNITYFPMTYDYCRALGLLTSWDAEKGLFIAGADTKGTLPIYETTDNSGILTATLPTYDIYVNGKKIDNSKQEYPLLNFRGVTYFPMTYDFSKEFLWTLDFTPEKFTVRRTTDDSGVNTRFLEENAVIFQHSTWETYWQEPDFIYTVYPTLSTRNHQNHYYRADLDTFEVTEIEEPDYSKSSTMFPDFTSDSAEVTETEDGKIYIDNMEVTDLGYESFKENIASAYEVRGYNLSATKIYSDNITFYQVIMQVHIILPGSGVYHYTNDYTTYVKIGDELVKFRKSTSPDSTLKAGDNVYFTARKFVKTIMTHHSEQAMLFYLPKGASEPVSLTDKLGISHAELLGVHDGKLYLKAYFTNPATGDAIDIGRDGYYTLDGDVLEKIGNYADVHYEFLKDDGSLYGINYYKKEFIKLN